ncbi:MAG: hypothetical protein J1F35_04955 [Erysipelotrichales bacterium]|nr:hypothetical protein [Erysipelotrichales bacterium]
MEEIDIGQLLNYFKSKFIFIIFAMSIAFCLASIYVNRFRVPDYTSYTTILLNKTNESESINASDLSLGKSLVSTYGEIIKSKKVLRTVINNLSLETDYGTLMSKINVSSVTDTSIIKISVTDHDSTEAANIANEIASVFAKEIVEIYNIENISIIDVAEVSEVASSASTIKIIGIATIAGAFIAVVLIFVAFYFDTTIKNEEDIERITGLPVIGIVPISREKIKGSAHRKYYENQAKKHKSQEILPVEREVRKLEVTNAVKPAPVSAESSAEIIPTTKKAEETPTRSSRHIDNEEEFDTTEISITRVLDEVVSVLEEEDKSSVTPKKKNYNGNNSNAKKTYPKRSGPKK